MAPLLIDGNKPFRLLCLRDVRDKARSFVCAREWDKFHTPVNLALALSGECGEISEIFQWKGPMEESNLGLLNSQELVNLGEEIADVFIYSIRLSDICNINLSDSIALYKSCNGDKLAFAAQYQIANIESACENLSFDDLNSYSLQKLQRKPVEIKSKDSLISPRQMALSIQSSAGDICYLFSLIPESQSEKSLHQWVKNDVSSLAYSLVNIVILLGGLTILLDTNIGNCCSDKFSKNEAKYPADLVKGSSAKYTTYQNKIELRRKKAPRAIYLMIAVSIAASGIAALLSL